MDGSFFKLTKNGDRMVIIKKEKFTSEKSVLYVKNKQTEEKKVVYECTDTFGVWSSCRYWNDEYRNRNI